MSSMALRYATAAVRLYLLTRLVLFKPHDLTRGQTSSGKWRYVCRTGHDQLPHYEDFLERQDTPVCEDGHPMEPPLPEDLKR
jgi:hypothetical protein